MSVEFCCDFCNEPLPKIMFGESAEATFYQTEHRSTRKLFPCLCKSCAEKLDQVVELARETWLKEIDISCRNTAINKARRELLGTDG